MEQNITTEDFHRHSVRRPRTLSISPSMQLSSSSAANYQQHHRSSVFAAVAPTPPTTMSTEFGQGESAVMNQIANLKQHKKQNLQIARELSDLVSTFIWSKY